MICSVSRLAALEAARAAKNALKLVRVCVAELPPHKSHLIELAGASFTVSHQREHCSTLAERENAPETRKQTKHANTTNPTHVSCHLELHCYHGHSGIAVLIGRRKRKLILQNFELSHNLTSGKRFVATQAIAHYAHSTATALNATHGSGLVGFSFCIFSFSRSHAMRCAIELARTCCSVSVACGSVACLFLVWGIVFARNTRKSQEP